MLLDSPAVEKRLDAAGIGRSRVSLHRFLNRPAEDNPFPPPLRHTETGRRYWQESEIAAWMEREARRRSADGVDPADLVPDGDPARWAPGGRARGAADLASDGATPRTARRTAATEPAEAA